MDDKIKLFSENIGKTVSYNNDKFRLDGIIAADLSIQDSADNVITLKKGSLVLTGDFSGIGHIQTGTVDINECKLN